MLFAEDIKTVADLKKVIENCDPNSRVEALIASSLSSTKIYINYDEDTDTYTFIGDEM